MTAYNLVMMIFSVLVCAGFLYVIIALIWALFEEDSDG